MNNCNWRSHEARRFLKLEFALIGKVEGDHWKIIGLFQPGNPSFAVGQVLSLEETCCGIAFDEKQVVGIHHLSDSEYRSHPGHVSLGMEAFIYFTPLLVGGEPFGTLSFASLTPGRRLTILKIMFCQPFGGLGGDAIERIRRERQQLFLAAARYGVSVSALA